MLNQIKQDLRTAIAARNLPAPKNIIHGYLGMPGIGKTEMVRQAAQDLNLSFAGDMVLSSCSPFDIMGKVPDNQAHLLHSYPNSDIPTQSKVGDTPTVWFIDEITNATSDTLKALQQGLLSRKFGEHDLGRKVIIVLAGNRQTDKAGSSCLSSAIYNRVTWRNWEWDSTHSDKAVMYIVDKHLTPYDTPAATDLRALLMGYFAHAPILEKDFTDALAQIGRQPYIQWCSPRSLEALVVRASCNAYQLPSITDMAGDIGTGRATALAGFAALLGKLPKYEAVIKDPTTARLPTEVDAQYAMVAMLATRLTAEDFAAVWEYVSRTEQLTMQVVFLRMMLKQKCAPIVRTTAAYKDIYKTRADLVQALTDAA